MEQYALQDYQQGDWQINAKEEYCLQGGSRSTVGLAGPERRY